MKVEQTELQRKVYNREIVFVLMCFSMAVLVSLALLTQPTIEEVSIDVFSNVGADKHEELMYQANALITDDPSVIKSSSRWRNELERLVGRTTN